MFTKKKKCNRSFWPIVCFIRGPNAASEQIFVYHFGTNYAVSVASKIVSQDAIGLGVAVEIKGIQHAAEISRTTELSMNEERFRYNLRRLDSDNIIYWGHEHSEDAAIQMAHMYLTLLDDCVSSARSQSGSRRRVQFLASPAVSSGKARAGWGA